METSNESPKETPIEKVENPTEENESLKEFLGETPKEETKEPEKVEEPEEKEEVKEQEEEIPLEEVVAEVKKKTKEETMQEVLKSLGVTKEEEKKIEEQGYTAPWKKRGEEAPATWDELLEASAAYRDFKKDEQEKITSEQQRHQMALVKERELGINTEWDGQLDYLRSEGLIPEVDPKIAEKLKEGKVLTNAERQDPGLQAQVGIFEAMYAVAQEREAAGQKPIVDAVHIFNRYYKKPVKSVGAKAPVSGGSIPISSKEEEIPYDKLHGSTFEELIG